MISFPSIVLIERGAIEKVRDVVNELGFKDVLIVCDPNLREFGEKIKSLVEGEIIFQYTQEKKELEKIKVKESVIIGVGGGRTIDNAKYIAYCNNKPWISFPTILSHDGIASSRAAIQDSRAKVSFNVYGPKAIVVDIDIIERAPYRFMAAGAADAISNITAVEDWRLGKERGEEFNTVSAELALIASKAVMRHAKEIANLSAHGIEVLTWSLICSGMSMVLAGSSRPASVSEHNFSHALEALNSPMLHGEQVAIGTLIASYLQNKDWKRIKNILSILKLPLTFEEIKARYDVEKEMFIKALVMAKDVRGYERYTILDRYNIDNALAEKILNEIGFF